MRLKRRRLILRSIRARGDLTCIVDRTGQIRPDHVRVFSTLRNEYERLPYFLDHYRALGAGHFLFVLNDCSDESESFLKDQPDVSLWRSDKSYKASRFGVDWTMWLQFAYGHGAWCLCVDADELLIYPHWQTRDLFSLTRQLESQNATALGALMLDLYPKGPLGTQHHVPGQNPTELLNWFDTTPYRAQRQRPAKNLWVQGGPRARTVFATDPRRAPTLNKLPLVHWSRRYAYLNATHSLLPPHLNMEWDGPPCVSGDTRLSGVLLHTKFLPHIIERSRDEKKRKEHFGHPDQFDGYYDWLISAPDLWHKGAFEYEGWQQLERLGLLSTGGWR